MPRIVAGQAKGMALKVPNSARPTPDRVREALFSTLAHRGYLDDTCVIDLYAGSGACALEAASRGATSGTAVEASRAGAAIIQANAEKAGLHLQVINQKVERWLASAITEADLIFADPPYDLPEAELASVIEGAAQLLVFDGLLVVERSSRSPEPVWPEFMVRDQHKVWGDTAVWSAIRADYASSLES